MTRPSGRRSRWLWAAVFATVAALAQLSGSGQGPPWAQTATQWIEARDLASHRSVAEMMRFQSPASVDLLCCNQMRPIQGRDALANFLAGRFDSIKEATMGRSYIDVSGSVVEYRLSGAANDDQLSGEREQAYADELQVSEHAGDGAATRTVHAVALQVLESQVDARWPYYAEDLRGAKGLGERYLSAWSGRDGPAVGGLYAANATILDSLLGVRLTGRDAIESYAAEHGGARLRLEVIPHGGGPAVYGYWREFQNHLTAYLTYTGDDGNGCPGGVTTQLQVEQGRIVAERRYHDVASMRRCVNSAQLPDGWWTHAVIPPPIEDRVTGTVTAAGREVEVHNGSAAADDLVRWAMAQFPAAKLTAPEVASVAFGEEAHRAQCSTDRWGLSLQVGSSSHIYLCSAVAGTATPLEREMLLHELAHAWMWQNLAEPIQEQFIARMHVPTWDGSDVSWDHRGVEQAAEVIAWGLADAPLEAEELAGRSCADLTEAFRLLTGVAPLRPACPDQ